ncbi:glutaminyl-peptide cyclotransferase [Flavisolibacter tropicus]|uniref:Glutamine cyclotransferase n=1 Tax=Flavisolibacter tropicus TaxID=1492898 RepID=A0A172TXQ9_9BACT|nr:glutaminyl-peptide cyclotransferase [Flavisolibacter tropicus]ANE51879.1 hypothetical protein SY85_16650 [Flavisolibacter tropicus]
MEETNAVPLINYTLHTIHPHDTSAYTEGLLVHNGVLYESTSADTSFPQTRSLFGTVDLTTGHISPKVELDRKKYFGEGITFLNNKVYQLTYLTKVGFIYDAKSFKPIGEFSFPSREGWGLTNNGRVLIMSDGTPILTYLDPSSFQVQKTLLVSDNNGPVKLLNDLEYINGFIYANIFTTNSIVKIDTATGAVVGRLDLTSLAQDAKLKYPGSLEMNGIAFNPANDSVYVTGKMWPHIYEISFSH